MKYFTTVSLMTFILLLRLVGLLASLVNSLFGEKFTKVTKAAIRNLQIYLIRTTSYEDLRNDCGFQYDKALKNIYYSHDLSTRATTCACLSSIGFSILILAALAYINVEIIHVLVKIPWSIYLVILIQITGIFLIFYSSLSSPSKTNLTRIEKKFAHPIFLYIEFVFFCNFFILFVMLFAISVIPFIGKFFGLDFYGSLDATSSFTFPIFLFITLLIYFCFKSLSPSLLLFVKSSILAFKSFFKLLYLSVCYLFKTSLAKMSSTYQDIDEPLKYLGNKAFVFESILKLIKKLFSLFQASRCVRKQCSIQLDRFGGKG